VRWANLGSIRPFLPGIPVMALSATLSPYGRRFVHRSFDMSAETSFIHRSIDRPNIYLHTRITESTLKDYKELYWLAPAAIRHPADIHQTIVFIDSRGGCKKACSEFWNLEYIPEQWKVRYPWTFWEVSTVLSGNKRTQAMAAFRAGLVRVLFATEVAGMGVDFPNVKRVIQWQIKPTLTAASLWQRFGRAARNPAVVGVAILYHTKRALIRPSDDAVSRLRADPAEAPQEVPAILAMIEAYATSKTPQKPAKDPLDYDIVRPEPEPELYDITGLLPESTDENGDRIPSSPAESPTRSSALRALSLAGDSLSEVDVRSRYAPEDESDSSAGSSASSISAGSKSTQEHEPDDEPSDCEGDEVYGSGSECNRGQKSRNIPAVCRGVLWTINTTGCVRGTFLLQFDEIGLNLADLDVSNALDPRYPCCDRHTHPSDASIPEELRVLLPPDDKEDESDHGNETDKTTDIEMKPNPKSSKKVASWAKRDVIYKTLYNLRDTVWQELVSTRHGIFTPYTPRSILPEEIIAVLARNCDSINTVSDIEDMLTSVPGVNVDRDLRWISVERMFEVISPKLAELRASIRRGAPRKERAPFIPPHSLQSEDATEENRTAIARLNAEALAQHEASQDALQTQRAKQREYQAKRKALFAAPSESSISRSLRPTTKRIMHNHPELTSQMDSNSKQPGPDDSENEDNDEIPPVPLRYERQYIPEDLRSQLPKIPAGRPSKSKQKERHDMIDAYWKSKADMQ
jgi:superfamily II DNA/RNA helicase